MQHPPHTHNVFGNIKPSNQRAKPLNTCDTPPNQELETRCVQLESRDTQYRASLRKKEAEYGRLQDSLRRTAEKTSSIISRGAGKGGAKGRYDVLRYDVVKRDIT